MGKVRAQWTNCSHEKDSTVWSQKGHPSNVEGVTKETSRDLVKMRMGLGGWGWLGGWCRRPCLLLQHLQSPFPLPVLPITGSAHHAAETSRSLFLTRPYLCLFHFSFWILIQALLLTGLSGLPYSNYVLLCNPRALCTFRIANHCCNGAFAFVIICIPHLIGVRTLFAFISYILYVFSAYYLSCLVHRLLSVHTF